MDSLKEKLTANAPILGTFLKTPSSIICEVMARSDFDAICIDAEHAPFDRGDIDQSLYAINNGQKHSIVRIPALRGEYILNALDCGAEAVLTPHICDAEQAEYLVQQVHYGQGRGYAGSSRAAGYMAYGMQEYIDNSNKRSCAIAQIEDKKAIENLDDILAVKGIDCFFIGRADLTVSMGLNNPNDPIIIECVEMICRKAKEAGRCVGMFTANIEEISTWRALGVSLFLLGSDHSFMLQGAADFAASVRKQF